MPYSDGGHRPHADFKGEWPVANPITRGPQSLRVTLDTWGPQDNIFPAMYDALQSNWGNAPSRTVDRMCRLGAHHGPEDNDWEHRTGWCRLTEGEQDYVKKCFAGQTLQQILESLTFLVLVDGCSRATTHQLVRTRIGAGFMQHGGRDNDWRHRPWTMPETIHRACAADALSHGVSRDFTRAGVMDWAPIDRLKRRTESNYDVPNGQLSLQEVIEYYLEFGRDIYSALVDAGIPWQDARRLLWMGTQTYIHEYYNFLALKGVLANRLEHVMDWEINCVAQLLLREVKMKCPPLVSAFLGSRSDLTGRDMFAGLDSWPPVGKYPNPHERCKVCGHAKANHFTGPTTTPEHGITLGENGTGCEACVRSSAQDLPFAYHAYEPHDTLPRAHRPEQNPFWVLHPDSMEGYPVIGWIATDGTYSKEFPVSPEECEIVVRP